MKTSCLTMMIKTAMTKKITTTSTTITMTPMTMTMSNEEKTLFLHLNLLLTTKTIYSVIFWDFLFLILSAHL